MSTFLQVSDQVKHSAAHITAMAIMRLFPNVRVGIGPVTKEGFYYDVESDTKITEKDIPAIESTVNQIVQDNLPFTQLMVSKDNALNMLLQNGQIYKAELVKAIADAEISFFKTGDEFIDLCRGPHVNFTGQVGVIKIIKIEDVHWKEDLKRPVMQRVYGVVFRNIEEFNQYMHIQKEIKERNYKELLSSKNLAALTPNNTLFATRGTAFLQAIRNIIKDIYSDNYKEITAINIKDLTDLNSLILSFYANKILSYKSLPLEFSTNINIMQNVKNVETPANSDAFISLLRVQDSPIHLGDLITKSIRPFEKLDIEIVADLLCTNLDDDNVNIISNVLKNSQISHTKILSNIENAAEVKINAKDSLGRLWNLALITVQETGIKTQNSNREYSSTLQVTTVFNLQNILAFILENNDGIVPEILKPFQILCIPIDKKQRDYANSVSKALSKKSFRAEADLRSKSLKYKIWAAEKEEIPVVLILGNKEEVNNSVSIRYKGNQIGLMSMENLYGFLDEKLHQ